MKLSGTNTAAAPAKGTIRSSNPAIGRGDGPATQQRW